MPKTDNITWEDTASAIQHQERRRGEKWIIQIGNPSPMMEDLIWYDWTRKKDVHPFWEIANLFDANVRAKENARLLMLDSKTKRYKILKTCLKRKTTSQS